MNFSLKATTFSELFQIKLRVKTLRLKTTSMEDRRHVYLKTLETMSGTLRYIEISRHFGPDKTEQTIFFEANYVFKYLQM